MNFINVLGDVTCMFGTKPSTIPGGIVDAIRLVVNLIKIGVPIILIIMGMLDLGKAVMAQKEDEIKKGQQTFIKRLIAAAVVFFIIFIVQLLVSLVASSSDTTVWPCIKAIIGV